MWTVIVIAGSILFCFLWDGLMSAPWITSGMILGCIVGLSAIWGFSQVILPENKDV